MRYSRVGQLDVRDVQALSDEGWQFDTSYNMWSPIGVFIQLYPVAGTGVFVGVSGSFGWIPAMSNPRPGTIDATIYTAGYALEAGYESTKSKLHGFGAFLRFGGWDGTESPIYSDFPEGMSSYELTLGVRGALRPD